MPDRLHRYKAEIFQALAHPTRVAIVETLAGRELSAGQLIERLELEQANASQHLAVLRAKRVVGTRRAGNQIYYSLRDPVLTDVLGLLRDYFFAHFADIADLNAEL